MIDIKTIEFGGGDCPKYRPNVDIRKLSNVDIVIDLKNPLPISEEEYDLVYSKYLLEHISWRNVKNFIKEIYRILKPKGKIEIITSNLLEQAKVLVNTKEWNNDLVGMIFGGQDYGENAHQCGFSPDFILTILNDIGFKDIKIYPIMSDFGPTDMKIEAIKPDNIIKTNIINDTKTINREINTGHIVTINSEIDRRQWILNKCKIGEKMLDVGCADGWIFKNTPFVQYVTNIDLDIYDIPNFQQMDAHNLKFEDKSFDIVILGEILEHVEDPVQVLKEANRVGKRILMTIPDEVNWSPENYPFETIEQGMQRRNLTLEQIAKVSNPNAKELYTKDNHKHLFHNRYYTEDTLKRDLETSGIIDYEMIRLQYGQPKWSFFTVETKLRAQPIDSDIKIVPTKKGPIITTGPIIKEGIKEDTIKDKLRIALISTPFFSVPPKKYGGLEQVIWDLAVGLDELGHNVTIFGPEGSIAPKNGHLIIIGPSNNSVNVDWLKLEKHNYERYKEHITPEKFDIIHDHSWFSFAYLSKMNNQKLKVLHTNHGGYSWESSPPVSHPNLVAISVFMKQYTIQYFKQIGYNVKCEYVYNGIDLDKYPFDPNVKKTNRLLYVGRFSKFKRPNIAIEIAKKTNLPIDLIGGTFVDDINYLKEIESMCDEHNIVIYKDASHDFKITKMQEAKCLIFPSKMGEPLGLVAQEAMSCGTPVVASKDGAIPEVVLHNKTGFICNTEEEMIEAIKSIDKIHPLECRKRAEEFSRLQMAKNYEKLYYRILDNDEW